MTGLEEAAVTWSPAAGELSPATLTDTQQDEVREMRAQTGSTRRAVVRVIDYMGDDGAIVQAARVSYGRGTKKVSDDRGLINYLMRMRHTSPSEMCELKVHVKLPIFVARRAFSAYSCYEVASGLSRSHDPT